MSGGDSEKMRARLPRSAGEALRRHWRLYVYEGVELAIFMIAACAACVWLFGAGSRMGSWVGNAAMLRWMMGVAMGATAVGIIHSPMGKRSGAHFNPAITLTYLRLRKIAVWDAVGYVVGQFVGGVAGVGVVALLLGASAAQPSVRYAVTVPGVGGVGAAFAAEFFMAALLFGAVLWTTNRKRWAAYTSYMVGALIMFYVLLFAPVSGFSINPARTVGSAVFARVWTSVWLYFAAPLAGMLSAAEAYVRVFGRHTVHCAKLHPSPSHLCPFACDLPECASQQSA